MEDQKQETGQPTNPPKISTKKRLSKKGSKLYFDGYDDDYIGDENDRRYLNSLNELEREKIIEQRHQNRQQLLEQQRLLDQYKKSGMKISEPLY